MNPRLVVAFEMVSGERGVFDSIHARYFPPVVSICYAGLTVFFCSSICTAWFSYPCCLRSTSCCKCVALPLDNSSERVILV